jgi:hypothetical protein
MKRGKLQDELFKPLSKGKKKANLSIEQTG